MHRYKRGKARSGRKGKGGKVKRAANNRHSDLFGLEACDGHGDAIRILACTQDIAGRVMILWFEAEVVSPAIELAANASTRSQSEIRAIATLQRIIGPRIAAKIGHHQSPNINLTAQDLQSWLRGGALAVAPFWGRASDTELFGLRAKSRSLEAFSRKAAPQ
jgi:hypothetical protein